MEPNKRNWAAGYGSSQRQNNFDARPGQYGLRPPDGVTDPKCMPRNLAFTSKFAIETILARYVLPAGEGGTTGTFNLKALVYSPSNRLTCYISVVIEPDNQSSPDPSFFVTPTMVIQAMSRNPFTGRETPLQQAFPITGSENVPSGYEFASALDLARVTVTTTDTAFATAYCPNTERANVKMIVEWEPNEPMTLTERDELYSKCSVTYGSPALIQNNAA